MWAYASSTEHGITGQDGSSLAEQLLKAIRDALVAPRFCQASSSEMFGASPPPQAEDAPAHPRSPYAVAKVTAFWITVNYRESHGVTDADVKTIEHQLAGRGVRTGERG